MSYNPTHVYQGPAPITVVDKLSWCQCQSRRREKECSRTSSPDPQLSGLRLQGGVKDEGELQGAPRSPLGREATVLFKWQGSMGAVRRKGTAPSQNRRRWQTWGTMPQRDPELKDMQDCFVHFGATCKGATDRDRLGWELLRTDVYKGTAELPGPGPGPVASAPYPTPSF